MVFEMLSSIQQHVSERFGGIKIDVYRKAGKGIICVRHGHALTPDNVLYAIPDPLWFEERE